MWIPNAPNPGSDAAREMGCRCPVMDNNHGKWAPYPPDGWWQIPGCPVHDAPVPPRDDAAIDAYYASEHDERR